MKESLDEKELTINDKKFMDPEDKLISIIDIKRISQANFRGIKNKLL